MLTSITDVDREILYKLSDGDILKACSVNKAAAEKICNDLFFYNLLLKRYPKALSFLEKEDNNEKDKENKYKQIYLKIVYYKDEIKTITEKKYGHPFIFTDGNVKLYHDILYSYYRTPLINAALDGLKDYLNYLLGVYNDQVNYGNLLEYLVRGNHFTLAEIKQIIGNRKIHQFDYDAALKGALATGNKELEQYLISKGANLDFAVNEPDLPF